MEKLVFLAYLTMCISGKEEKEVLLYQALRLLDATLDRNNSPWHRETAWKEHLIYGRLLYHFYGYVSVLADLNRD